MYGKGNSPPITDLAYRGVTQREPLLQDYPLVWGLHSLLQFCLLPELFPPRIFVFHVSGGKANVALAAACCNFSASWSVCLASVTYCPFLIPELMAHIQAVVVQMFSPRKKDVSSQFSLIPSLATDFLQGISEPRWKSSSSGGNAEDIWHWQTIL